MPSYSYTVDQPVTQPDLPGAVADRVDAIDNDEEKALAVQQRRAVLAVVQALSDARYWGQFTVQVNGESDDHGSTLNVVVTDGDQEGRQAPNEPNRQQNSDPNMPTLGADIPDPSARPEQESDSNTADTAATPAHTAKPGRQAPGGRLA